MDGKAAVALIAQHGCGGLGGFDGCVCTHFEVQGFAVDISCRKGSGMDTFFRDFYGIGVRVTSRHMDSTPETLQAVAREVVKEFDSSGYDIMVRYCTYEEDKKCACSYCGKPRKQADYLCEKCASGNDALGQPIAPNYTYGFGGMLPPPTGTRSK